MFSSFAPFVQLVSGACVSRDIWCFFVPAVFPECTVSWWACTPVHTLWPSWCEFPNKGTVCSKCHTCRGIWLPLHTCSAARAFGNPRVVSACLAMLDHLSLGNPVDFSTIHWLQPWLLQWGLNPAVFELLFQVGPSLGIFFSALVSSFEFSLHLYIYFPIVSHNSLY